MTSFLKQSNSFKETCLPKSLGHCTIDTTTYIGADAAVWMTCINSCVQRWEGTPGNSCFDMCIINKISHKILYNRNPPSTMVYKCELQMVIMKWCMELLHEEQTNHNIKNKED